MREYETAVLRTCFLYLADRALAEGKMDMVSMGRAWVSNPDYGTLVYENRADDIVPCIRCNKCNNRSNGEKVASACSVNPLIGIEHRLHLLLTEPGPPKKAAVVGGGPAGMKAAIGLCDRGHDVTIFEAKSELGGAVRHADYAEFKWPLRDFKDYLIHQVEKRGITVNLGTKADFGLIKEGGYDAVVVAVGAAPVVPKIPGIESREVVFAQEAFAEHGRLGRNVVVIGGGEVGMEAGMHLAKNGHDVTVLEMRSLLAADTTLMHYRAIFEKAWQALDNLHPVTDANVTKIGEASVEYTDKDGHAHSIPCDSVVAAAGMRALKDEALAFYGAADRFICIGDCTYPRTIHDAMRSALGAVNSL